MFDLHSNATASPTGLADESRSISNGQPSSDGEPSVQLVTFRVGAVRLGIEVHQVQEINRTLDVTPVPKAADVFRGVINLRGDVVTVLNLHVIFGLEDQPTVSHPRNLILSSDGQRVGVLVDQVLDILVTKRSQMVPPTTHVEGVDRRFVDSIVVLDDGVLIVVDASALLGDLAETSAARIGTEC